MRTTFILFIALFVIVFCASAQERDTQPRGLTVEAAPESIGTGREITGKKYAVLVGVTEYQNMTNLRFTKNDAEALRDQLLAIGFAPNDVRTLTDGSGGNNEPTKQNIEQTVRDILGRARDGDLVVIFLSGHGTQPADLGPLFCPPEADHQNLRNTAVLINNIRDGLGNSNASFKLLIVDACRDDNPFGITANNTGARTIPVSVSAGSISTGSTDTLGFKGVTLESVDTNAPLQNLTVFQSCSPGQISWEDGRLNHGIFTHFIVEGLRGRAENSRGDITMDGLLTYAITETSYYVEENIQREQNPWRAGEGNDFVLANRNRHNLPRPRQETEREIRRITALNLPQQPSELPPIPDGIRRIDVATSRELLAAVNPSNLRDGDVIVLKPGVYTLTDSLNIAGRHPLDTRTGEPIVLYGDPSSPQKVQIRINRRDSRINITRNTPLYLIGLDITSTNGEGVRVDGEAEVGILFCSIHNCNGDGIYNRSSIFVDGSVISGNDNGFQTSGRFDVNNSRIERNRNNGVIVTRTATGRFSDNILFDNVGTNWRVLGNVQN